MQQKELQGPLYRRASIAGFSWTMHAATQSVGETAPVIVQLLDKKIEVL